MLQRKKYVYTLITRLSIKSTGDNLHMILIHENDFYTYIYMHHI